MPSCLCGEEIADRFVFCPHCGIDLQWSAEMRGMPVSSSSRSLCRTLRACATRTFERLAAGHFEGAAPNEEAFTQFNLQDLRQLHRDRVLIREFQRHEEARNGADWEWWFHSGDVGFGMRVQAKRMKRGGGYDLEHVVRRTGRRQSQLLVQDALATGCIPAYVLYNHRNWVPASELGRAVNCRHGLGEQTQLGCTIVSALTVHAALRGPSVSPAQVRDRSMPWHRVLCDEPNNGQTGLEAAHAEVKALHRRGADDLLSAVRAPILRALREQTVVTPVRRQQTDTGMPDQKLGESRPASLDDYLRRAEEEVLSMPVYEGLSEVADRPLSRLPDRVVAMLRGRVTEPPDDRVNGAVLVNLSSLP
ncbi:DUF6615 family protein [Streptomyces nondiastaticus]|uniref:DUF6615 family protein n=1 Tax=Streptomyces nondiastaticus TaxID=3154512 RepID=A0ABW6TTY6_9ACTN